ncbi:hypothetical protein EMIT0P2_10843 [Pseudomonas sp. IT-P2]
MSANVAAATTCLILKGLLILIFYYFKCIGRYCTVAPLITAGRSRRIHGFSQRVEPVFRE